MVAEAAVLSKQLPPFPAGAERVDPGLRVAMVGQIMDGGGKGWSGRRTLMTIAGSSDWGGRVPGESVLPLGFVVAASLSVLVSMLKLKSRLLPSPMKCE